MKIIAYHGTNAKFDKFSQDKATFKMASTGGDFYGGGVGYFTSSEKVAVTYAKANSKKSGEPYVYMVELNIKKLFDVDYNYTGNELVQFYDEKTTKDFAVNSKLARLGGDDIYSVIVKLTKGAYNLSGDKVFKGLSAGMANSGKAAKKLISLGYNSLRYNGGVNMNMQRHDVYIMYSPNDINILKVIRV